MACKKAPLGTAPRRPGEADRHALETQLLQLVSPHSRVHRSEGMGLTIADAMALGMPVFATGWSGNTDYMDVSHVYAGYHSGDSAAAIATLEAAIGRGHHRQCVLCDMRHSGAPAVVG